MIRLLQNRSAADTTLLIRQLHIVPNTQAQLVRRLHQRPVSRWKGRSEQVSLFVVGTGRVSSPYRSFATNLPNDVHTKSTDSIPPIPPSQLISKGKHKVELRPGPAKPGSIDSSAKASSSTPPSPDAAKASSPSSARPLKPPPRNIDPSTPLAAPPDPAESSIVQMAKFDIEDAAKHGVLKPPPENAGWARKLFHQAKELFKFYLTGIKLIIKHRRDVRAIRERVRTGGAPISRAESQFMKVYDSDVKKLVPFVLLLLVIEEIIPLIVLYAPGFLPSTCILPSQRARIDRKRHDRQREAFALLSGPSKQIAQKALATLVKKGDAISISEMDTQVIKPLCSLIGLPSYGPHFLVRSRLEKRLRLLVEDDELLILEGSGERLTPIEAEGAVWERGMIADQFNPRTHTALLSSWLAHVTPDTPRRNASAGNPLSYIPPTTILTPALQRIYLLLSQFNVERR